MQPVNSLSPKRGESPVKCAEKKRKRKNVFCAAVITAVCNYKTHKGTSDAICFHKFLSCLFNLIDEHREEKQELFKAVFLSAIFGYMAVGASIKDLARLGDRRRTGKGELNHFIHTINLKESWPSAKTLHVEKDACMYVPGMTLVLSVICIRDWLQQKLLDPDVNTPRKQNTQN